MTFNAEELRGRIYSLYRSQAEFNRKLNWGKNKINRILNGDLIPNIIECELMAEALQLSQQEYCSIFLPNLSPIGDKSAANNQAS